MTIEQTRQFIIESFLEAKLIGEADQARLLTDDSADVDLASLPIDSLKIVDLCMALETRLAREVQVEELVENDSLNKLARHLASAA